MLNQKMTGCPNSFQTKYNNNDIYLMFHIKPNSSPNTDTSNSLSTFLNDQCFPASVSNIDTNLLIVTYPSNLET